ncbi:hypothetical protein ACFYE2_16305, partial [Kocuria sp. CPCC 205300]|uniref:hypothetical protein n=1 Tax=Kocuria sabuli TaxID=3071448 RepID=UPI0036DF87C5
MNKTPPGPDVRPPATGPTSGAGSCLGEDPANPRARFELALRASGDQPITVRAEGADSTRTVVWAGTER